MWREVPRRPSDRSRVEQSDTRGSTRAHRGTREAPAVGSDTDGRASNGVHNVLVRDFLAGTSRPCAVDYAERRGVRALRIIPPPVPVDQSDVKLATRAGRDYFVAARDSAVRRRVACHFVSREIASKLSNAGHVRMKSR